jgi:indole-3-glycerol phosphate synthase
MSDTLARIVRDKRAHVARRKAERSEHALFQAAAAQDRPRGFQAALERAVAAGRYGLIAEIKKASPARGLIRADFLPPALAPPYAAGGASCLSVLTEPTRFARSDAELTAEARAGILWQVTAPDFRRTAGTASRPWRGHLQDSGSNLLDAIIRACPNLPRNAPRGCRHSA